MYAGCEPEMGKRKEGFRVVPPPPQSQGLKRLVARAGERRRRAAAIPSSLDQKKCSGVAFIQFFRIFEIK